MYDDAHGCAHDGVMCSVSVNVTETEERMKHSLTFGACAVACAAATLVLPGVENRAVAENNAVSAKHDKTATMPGTHTAAATLDPRILEAVQAFKREVKGGDAVLERASGYLVFPRITKAGLGVGAEYGKGALVQDGAAVAYYRTAGASIGLQAGVEKKSMVMAFMTDSALNDFKRSSGWEAGVDGAITVIDKGSAGSINTTTTQKPIVAFVFGEAGLMADASLSGSKFTKIDGLG